MVGEKKFIMHCSKCEEEIEPEETCYQIKNYGSTKNLEISEIEEIRFLTIINTVPNFYLIFYMF